MTEDETMRNVSNRIAENIAEIVFGSEKEVEVLAVRIGKYEEYVVHDHLGGPMFGGLSYIGCRIPIEVDARDLATGQVYHGMYHALKTKADSPLVQIGFYSQDATALDKIGVSAGARIRLRMKAELPEEILHKLIGYGERQ